MQVEVEAPIAHILFCLFGLAALDKVLIAVLAAQVAAAPEVVVIVKMQVIRLPMALAVAVEQQVSDPEGNDNHADPKTFNNCWTGYRSDRRRSGHHRPLRLRLTDREYAAQYRRDG